VAEIEHDKLADQEQNKSERIIDMPDSKANTIATTINTTEIVFPTINLIDYQTF
jgi:hypothetical protein